MISDCTYRAGNEKGYTLVELITVMAIMMVMVGLLALGTSVMFSKDAEYVAKTIDDELSEVRMLSMSKSGTFELVLHIDPSKPEENSIIIRQEGADIKTVNLKRNANLLIEYGTETADSGDIAFEFDKGNGSVKRIGGDDFSSGVCSITATSTRLTTKTAVVDLVAATGRHYVRK